MPSAHFESPDAGIGVTVDVTGLTLTGAQAGDYELTATTTTAGITPASLSVAGITAAGKVYDGTTDATLDTAGAMLTGTIYDMDDVALDDSGAVGAFESPDAGIGVTVDVTGLTLTGAEAGDYSLTPTTTTAGITPASLSVTGITADDKVYDGTTGATLDTDSAALSGTIYPDDQVALDTTGAVGAFASQDVGSGLTVTVTGLTLTGAQAGDYELTATTTTAGITPASLSVAGITAAGKVYDGTTDATLDTAGAMLTGTIYDMDDVALDDSAAVGAFESPDAGIGVTVNVTGLTLTGAQAGDYSLTPTSTQADITPATLSVTGITAADKVYDGTTGATLDTTSAALSGTVYPDDQVALDASGAVGTFASPDVGPNITATVTGLTLEGAQAGDYSLTPTSTSASITPATPTVTAIDAGGTYDGTAFAASATVTGVNDAPVTDGSVSYEYYVGEGTSGTDLGVVAPIDADTYTVVAAFSGDANYDAADSVPLTFTITPASLSVAGITAAGKVYDGTTDATLDTSGATLTGTIYDMDDVALDDSGAVGASKSSDAGSGIAVNVSGLTLTGAQAGDYVLSPTATTADITPATLSVTGITAADKVYDGSTSATLDTDGAALSGTIYDGDQVGVVTSGAVGAFASQDVGSGITVHVTGLALDGAEAGDYILSPTSTTASITPASLSVTGITASDKVYDGTTGATLHTATATLGGTIYGDDRVTLDADGAVGTFASQDVGSGITVNVSGLTLGGAQAGDYTLTPTATTADITPAMLSVTGITASGKVYDGTTAAVLDTTGAALSGTIYGDDQVDLVTAGAVGAFASKDVATGVTVNVTGLTLGGSQAGDYSLTPTSTSADITPATLGVTGITAANKVYDGTTAATLHTTGATLSGTIYGDDQVELNAGGATGTFATAGAGTGIAVTVAGLALDGAQAGDYILSPTSTTADITPATPTVTATDAGGTYHDSAFAATSAVTGVGGVTIHDGSLSYTYYVGQGTSGTNLGSTAPVNAGTYTVVAHFSGDANYSAADSTPVSFTITRATLSVSGITAASKVYDGTTAATLHTAGASLSGTIYGSDEVELVTAGAVGTFASKDAGSGITVAVSGLALGGNQAGDYVLTPTATQADITPATLITTANDQSKVFGAPIPPLTVSYSGFVAGDSVRLSRRRRPRAPRRA